MKLNVLKTDAPWYADGLKFTCTQCGNCCTGAPGAVWLSNTEMHRLAEHLQMSVQAMANKYCRKIGTRWSLKERVSPKGEYDCIFLKTIEENGMSRRVCGIYQVRPLQCRTWPFWPEVIKSPESWQQAHQKCPGMGNGKSYTQDQIESLRDATDWPEKSKTPTSK
jgi:uncharacterized protein